MRDDDVRSSCFASLDVLCALFGEEVPYPGGLAEGFNFRGRKVPFLSTQLAGMDPAVAAERFEHSDGGALAHKTYRHLYEGEKREQAKNLEALVLAALGEEGTPNGRVTPRKPLALSMTAPTLSARNTAHWRQVLQLVCS